jgi:hypothetical protein
MGTRVLKVHQREVRDGLLLYVFDQLAPAQPVAAHHEVHGPEPPERIGDLVPDTEPGRS